METRSDAPLEARSPRFTRELTTLVAAPLAIWIIGWAHPLVFDLAIAVVSSLALYEFLSLGVQKGYSIPITLCIMVPLFPLAALVLEPISVEMGVFLALLVIPGAYVLSAGDLDQALPSSAIAVLGTLYVGMLGGSLIRLRNDFGAVGTKLVFFLLLVVWCGDAGAYYIGKKFGRTRLSPRISPRKTVEGGVGGCIVAILVALAIRATFFPEFPLLHVMIAGVILSITGVIGDLAESMWKRSAAVKDSGSMIPGHGGFLDRFDSIFFTAPILYSYWFLIVHHFQTIRIMSA